jgi:hypothetical protein
MYTVTTSLISPEGLPNAKFQRWESLPFETAADIYLQQCEKILQITPMVVEEKDYKESNDKWLITLEKVQ